MRRIGAFIPLLVVAGCAGSDAENAPFTVRDSMGVTIVDNATCSGGAAPQWAVADVPMLTIGQSGDEATEFFRIAGAVRFPDGRVAVADAGSHQLRLFTSGGEPIRTFGREGDGPGEFRSIESVRLFRDHLYVLDGRHGRVTVFDSLGNVSETIQLPLDLGNIHVMTDGMLIGSDGMTLAASADVPALVRDTAHIVSVTSTGVDTILSVPGGWTEYAMVGGSSAFRGQPYTVDASWSVDGERIFATSGERFDVFVANVDGEIERRVRRVESPRPLTDGDARRWRESFLEQVPQEQRAMVEPMLSVWTMPDRLPSYTDLHVDSDGQVWAKRFERDADLWDIYDDRGACLTTLELPPSFTMFESDAGYVLGKQMTDAGVEVVRILSLIGS